MTFDITLLTQADCGFCGHAKRVLDSISADHDIHLTEIDLDSETGRHLAHRARVLFAPGILLDGEPFSHGRLSERKLRRTLQRRENTPPPAEQRSP